MLAPATTNEQPMAVLEKFSREQTWSWQVKMSPKKCWWYQWVDTTQWSSIDV